MALPSSGSISMSQIRREANLSGSVNLGNSAIREIADRPSGSISMSHLKGKHKKEWVLIEQYRSIHGESSNNDRKKVRYSLEKLKNIINENYPPKFNNIDESNCKTGAIFIDGIYKIHFTSVDYETFANARIFADLYRWQ
ncbi:hypothetical protein IX317_000358 [Fusobacterium sp. DD29]|uniref:hypothetical protein n=1 Tax=unclassified Fusobacterium TaxID=2648384 RepID=UPI001B8CC55D|nr:MULTISPECIES: hypothetical protein [unclassified Fusobacterium]MBR8748699.1 hypothetical protein [Fusobacterium sp. DD29]MBR8760949.1 hypothetical protein [Fusobacterium sp. DD25]MBR8766978.1 hypothetical protein [Fusobacterium sp. DD43]MBR8770979.1 hypothetical protein [Fusobacterium sp. DD40]MBR8775254.1 hypothetical protein [Fusobacterium sp. DD17]